MQFRSLNLAHEDGEEPSVNTRLFGRIAVLDEDLFWISAVVAVPEAQGGISIGAPGEELGTGGVVRLGGFDGRVVEVESSVALGIA